MHFQLLWYEVRVAVRGARIVGIQSSLALDQLLSFAVANSRFASRVDSA